jgi:hypothetical protein
VRAAEWAESSATVEIADNVACASTILKVTSAAVGSAGFGAGIAAPQAEMSASW